MKIFPFTSFTNFKIQRKLSLESEKLPTLRITDLKRIHVIHFFPYNSETVTHFFVFAIPAIPTDINEISITSVKRIIVSKNFFLYLIDFPLNFKFHTRF